MDTGSWSAPRRSCPYLAIGQFRNASLATTTLPFVAPHLLNPYPKSRPVESPTTYTRNGLGNPAEAEPCRASAASGTERCFVAATKSAWVMTWVASGIGMKTVADRATTAAPAPRAGRKVFGRFSLRPRRIGSSTRKYESVAIAAVTAIRTRNSSPRGSPVRGAFNHKNTGQWYRYNP